MNLTCLQENLSRALAVVGRAVATRTTLPITQHVLLATDEGMLKLTATNLEIAISTCTGAMIKEEGSITVPARLLTEFIGSLPSGPIDLVVNDNPKSISITGGQFRARISGSDEEEFPPIPTLAEGEGVEIKVPAGLLRTAINQTALAAATEESRPVLTGIQVELVEDTIVMAAADGFRLAVYRGKLEESVPEPVSVIIPARTLNELNRLLPDTDDNVTVTLASGKGQAVFQTDNVHIVSQLISGSFPPYNDLLTDALKGITCTANLSVEALTPTARSVAVFARDSNNIMRLEMKPGGDGEAGKLIISASAEDVGENIADLEGHIEGEEAKIAFNSRYLLDVISAVGGDQICLRTSGPSRAGVFSPTGSENYIHLVMPMFINW